MDESEGRKKSNGTSQRTGRKKKKKKRSSIGIFFKAFFSVFIIGLFVVGGVIIGGLAGIIGSTPPLNTNDIVPENYTSVLYDNMGNEIDKLHGKENREYVKLEFIPKQLQLAVVAIEDERFYEHNGIDVKGIFRALITNIKTASFSQGASTITQQLIKNAALDTSKTIKRKVLEQYLAIRLEKDLLDKFENKEKAKNYILELYLNTIGLHHGLNGVEAASKFYFGKDVFELNLAEAACIAAITNNPSLYSPVSHPDKNKERQTLVLNKMLELGYITQQEYADAAADDIYSRIVGKKTTDEDAPSVHNYFIDHVIVSVADDLMKQRDMSRQQAYDMIYSGGLQIHTTINTEMQRVMEESFKNDALFPPSKNTLDVTYSISVLNTLTQKQEHHTERATVNTKEEAEAFAQKIQDKLLNDTHTLVLDNLTIANSLQAGMVILDYRTGEIKALVGGRGEKNGDLVFNRATQAFRQPGSCFKVLAAYAPAIDLNLVAPGTIIVDEPFSVAGWTPRNWYGAKYRGPCTVREGIRDSINILAAKTIVNVGPEKAFEYLENFGFTSLVRSQKIDGKIYTDISPAISLGGVTNGVSVLELTSAYGTIANNGVHIKPSCYSQVLDHNGNVLLQNNYEEKRVLKETTAYQLTDMMKDVITGGGSATGRLANFSQVKMPISGKTGTTNDDKDLTFAGYTPYYVGGIWMGYDDPKTIEYKKSYHLLLWKDVMEKIHQGLEYKDFEKPAGIETRSYCSASGGTPIAGVCVNDYYGGGVSTDICAADFGSTSQCTYHKTYKVDLSTGKLAGDHCPTSKVASVVLSVNPKTGEIANKPSPIPEDKVDISIHETCTKFHPNEGEDWSPDEEKDPVEGIIGGDETINNAQTGSGTTGDKTNKTPIQDETVNEPPSIIGADDDPLFIPE